MFLVVQDWEKEANHDGQINSHSSTTRMDVGYLARPYHTPWVRFKTFYSSPSQYTLRRVSHRKLASLPSDVNPHARYIVMPSTT